MYFVRSLRFGVKLLAFQPVEHVRRSHSVAYTQEARRLVRERAARHFDEEKKKNVRRERLCEGRTSALTLAASPADLNDGGR